MLKIGKIAPVAITLFLVNANNAKAEWTLPENPGLPENFDTGLNSIINWLLGFVIALSVIALIWGGLRYIGSSGSQDQAEGAKRTIKYAIMGLAVAGLAYAFVNLAVTNILT